MRIYLTCIALFFNSLSLAQVPGSIIDSAIPLVNPMNPNGDGYITSSGNPFMGPLDETEFELPFIPISQFQAEPADDNDYAPGCKLYELVNDVSQNAESGYYYYKDPDGLPDNGDEIIIFRLRTAKFSGSSSAFSILIDADYRFGFNGPEADLNAETGNPGFEWEVAAFTSTGSNGGVKVFDVDGTPNSVVSQYPLNTNYQVSYAYNQDPGCPDVPVFTDIYIPFSDLGILSTTQVRIAVAANEAVETALYGNASDIGGVDGNSINDHDDQFIAAILNYSPIDLGNPNNRAPIPVDATLSISEHATITTPIHTISASDPDGDILTYTLISGNAQSAFAVNSSTGEITINNFAALDKETNFAFTLLVRVSDGQLYDNAIITIDPIDVNEFPPSLVDVNFAVDENLSIGTVVYSPGDIDPDASDVLNFSITAGNTGSTFSINSSTGAILVANPSMLNFEDNISFSLAVHVTDGLNTDDGVITITLNNVNEPPSGTNATASLTENRINGSFVHKVIATDPDAGAVLSYSIVGGNTNTAFAINSTGFISVGNASALDFETTPVFSLTVQVSDGALSVNALITVNLNDVNEPPIASDATAGLDENSLNATLVHNVSATDPEANPILTYSIISGNTGMAFGINSTGSITINNASLLDFETTPTFILSVRVSDGAFFDDALITINLNDINERPTAPDAKVFSDENLPNGSVVHSMGGIDPDAGTALNYAIINGNIGATFTINNSGTISVNDFSLLDFESTPDFSLMVRISDGLLFADATVVVTLQNVNESPAARDADISIDEKLPRGTIVHQVIASDPDAGDILTFSIETGNINTAFAIDGRTGEIMINDPRQVSFDLNPVFDITVKARDRNSLAAFSLIRIELIDVPEDPGITPLKGFSPDGDGINDFWLIKGIEAFPDNEVKVFNRWGNLVFETRNYDNKKISWSGESNGNSQVLESTYYYIITVRELKPMTGYLIVKK